MRIVRTLVPAPGAERVFGLLTLVDSSGLGLVMTASVLYFTRVVHLSPGRLGLGMTLAGLIVLVVDLPLGGLADRYPPRTVLRVALTAQVVATIGYLFVHDLGTFVAVTSIDMLGMGVSGAAQGPLIRRIGGADATVFRASTRAITNVGLAFGAIGCAVAVQVGTPDAYRALLVGNALSFVGAWVVCGRLPDFEPLPPPIEAPHRSVLSDTPFVAYAIHNGVMSLQYSVITLPLPLWVLGHTHAPRWTASLCLVINALLVIGGQVGFGRNVSSVERGGTALRRAGLVFLVSCGAIGFAAGLPGWAALLLLAAAIVVHSVGEMWHAAASFALDFGLAPAHAQGQYQGLVTIGRGAAYVAAPALLIGVCLDFGRKGWVGLGLCFALLGLLAPAMTRWAARTRPPATVPQPMPPIVMPAVAPLVAPVLGALPEGLPVPPGERRRHDGSL
jgi:MFS transporter